MKLKNLLFYDRVRTGRVYYNRQEMLTTHEHLITLLFWGSMYFGLVDIYMGI